MWEVSENEPRDLVAIHLLSFRHVSVAVVLPVTVLLICQSSFDWPFVEGFHC